MKKFLLINTLRTASRAFYLNFAVQDTLEIPSRMAVDVMILQMVHAIKENKPNQALHLALSLKSTLSSEDYCLIFHALRPLLYDWNVSKQVCIIALKLVRQVFDIEVVFCPIRNVGESLLSEYNRAIASCLGDWNFTTSNHFWKRGFDAHNLSTQAYTAPTYDTFSKTVKHEEIHANMCYRPHFFEHWTSIFLEVFDELHFISYAQFVNKPEETFEHICAITGCSIENKTLFHTKLNGLSNRFLWNNPILLHFGDARQCRIFIDLQSSIYHNKDFFNIHYNGGLSHIRNNIHTKLPKTHAIIQEPLALGLFTPDLQLLTEEELLLVQDLEWLNKSLSPLLELYDDAFEKHHAFYRRMYTDDKNIIRQHFHKHVVAENRYLKRLSKMPSIKLEPNF